MHCTRTSLMIDTIFYPFGVDAESDSNAVARCRVQRRLMEALSSPAVRLVNCLVRTLSGARL